MYKIEYSKDLKKDLIKLPKDDLNKIFSKIQGLAKNPRPSGIEPLMGKFKGLCRIRSGNYRIIYQIVDKNLIILIVRVSHRKQVYKS